MQRLSLTEMVTIVGKDVWGRSSILTLEPNEESRGWTWWTGSEEIPITPALFELYCLGRTVALRHRESLLSEFEHVAFLHALGLRGVRVSCTSSWAPHMCARELWERLSGRLKPAGLLRPLKLRASLAEGKPVSRDVGWCAFIDELERHRQVTYSPIGNDLCFKVDVAYPGKEGRGRVSLTLKAGEGLPLSEIFEIASSRTLGRPAILRPLVWTLPKMVWPHWEKIVWMKKPYTKIFVELARHKIVDCMGIYSFAAPDGHYLAGVIYAKKSSHAMDLRLLRNMCAAIAA